MSLPFPPIIWEYIVKVNNPSLPRSLWVAFESKAVLVRNLQRALLLEPAGGPVLPLTSPKISLSVCEHAKQTDTLLFYVNLIESVFVYALI